MEMWDLVGYDPYDTAVRTFSLTSSLQSIEKMVKSETHIEGKGVDWKQGMDPTTATKFPIPSKENRVPVHVISEF